MFLEIKKQHSSKKSIVSGFKIYKMVTNLYK
jgi:hypothetical protein